MQLFSYAALFLISKKNLQAPNLFVSVLVWQVCDSFIEFYQWNNCITDSMSLKIYRKSFFKITPTSLLTACISVIFLKTRIVTKMDSTGSCVFSVITFSGKKVLFGKFKSRARVLFFFFYVFCLSIVPLYRFSFNQYFHTIQ